MLSFSVSSSPRLPPEGLRWQDIVIDGCRCDWDTEHSSISHHLYRLSQNCNTCPQVINASNRLLIQHIHRVLNLWKWPLFSYDVRCHHRQGGGGGEQDYQDGNWASLFWWPELNFRDDGLCWGNELGKLTAKFAKMDQNFFNPVWFHGRDAKASDYVWSF